MKCWSRSTLGVVIGILNVVCNIGLVIFSIVSLFKINSIGRNSNEEQKNEIASMRILFSVLIVVCLIMTIISGLLLMGIVKRRHKLMIPWVFLSWLGFIINCGSYIVKFFIALFSGAGLGAVFTLLIVGVIGYGISGLILWTIFTLYRDIRQENIRKPVGEMRSADLEQNYKTGI